MSEGGGQNLIVKIDGIESKEFGRRQQSFFKFLKDNTCAGKVSANVEIFKGVELQKDSLHWVMSTFDVDRDFERVDQSGWDLRNYLKNPVVLWSHDYKIPAIGYAENVAAGKALEGDIRFNSREFDEFGWSIGERVKTGALRAGSVGFRVDEVEFFDGKDGETNLIFRKQELLEFSICCVPSNPFALMENDCSGKTLSSGESKYFEKLKRSIARAGGFDKISHR